MAFLPLDAVRVDGGEGWGWFVSRRFVSVFFVVLLVVLVEVMALVLVVAGVDCVGGNFWGCVSPEAGSSSEPMSLGEGELVLLGVVSSGS